MKNLIYLLLSAILFTSCLSTKKAIPAELSDISYLIKKIDKENSWYIIYAERKDSLYKIVSKIDDSINENCKILVVGKQYNFDLQSMKKNAPMIGNVKLDPVGYTGCYQFDSKTAICLEPKKGIYDLFYTNDLKGICYLK